MGDGEPKRGEDGVGGGEQNWGGGGVSGGEPYWDGSGMGGGVPWKREVWAVEGKASQSREVE